MILGTASTALKVFKGFETFVSIGTNVVAASQLPPGAVAVVPVPSLNKSLERAHDAYNTYKEEGGFMHSLENYKYQLVHRDGMKKMADHMMAICGGGELATTEEQLLEKQQRTDYGHN